MEKITGFFRELLDFILTQAKGIGIVDVIDILLVTLVLYYLFKFIRDRRAGRLLVGVLFLIVLQAVGESVGLVTINYILQNVYQAGILALIVVFQPELRSMLERVGAEPLRGLKNIGEQKDVTEMQGMITALCDAVGEMAREKTGALIVVERDVRLDEYTAPKGTVIDSFPSSYLIQNIFFKNSPLHDGALIIRPPRMFAAGCVLPLSANSDIIESLGTRHRAAIGASENSDALVIVVSEETGTISVAFGGRLYRNFTPEKLNRALTKVFVDNLIKKKASQHATKEKTGKREEADRDGKEKGEKKRKKDKKSKESEKKAGKDGEKPRHPVKEPEEKEREKNKSRKPPESPSESADGGGGNGTGAGQQKP